jgi:hypothetical protein
MAMTDRANKHSDGRIDDGFDLEALLHPAGAFDHPTDVVNDPDLTLNEKRAILSSWASDACAVEAAPELRRPPGGRTVRFDEIMDALRILDREAGARDKPPPHYRRVLANRRPGIFARRRRGSNGDGERSIN